ncbi:Negative elongation factor E [Chionoecetes opilio]|uniref:Negative elongation factor E n=1 Tax=Chionoecetes opilio TaxID=41210 RepID=A0A8J4YQT3_CHIOP|nr:Negative elongation factor E [Chionoecetes opilio]
MNGSMVSGIQLKVSLARRQPVIDPINDASSSATWSTIGKGTWSLDDSRQISLLSGFYGLARPSPTKASYWYDKSESIYTHTVHPHMISSYTPTLNKTQSNKHFSFPERSVGRVIKTDPPPKTGFRTALSLPLVCNFAARPRLVSARLRPFGDESQHGADSFTCTTQSGPPARRFTTPTTRQRWSGPDAHPHDDRRRHRMTQQVVTGRRRESPAHTTQRPNGKCPVCPYDQSAPAGHTPYRSTVIAMLHDAKNFRRDWDARIVYSRWMSRGRRKRRPPCPCATVAPPPLTCPLGATGPHDVTARAVISQSGEGRYRLAR